MGSVRAVMAAVVLGLLLATYSLILPSGARFASSASNTGSAATAAALQSPGTPAATYQCAFASRSVKVDWTAPTSTAATLHQVWESTWNSSTTTWGNPVLVGSVAYGTNTLTDSSVPGSSQIRYRVVTIRTGTSWTSTPSAWSNIVNSPALCV